MTRGSVWWVELEGEAGFRPVVIVSRTAGLQERQKVTVAEITRTIRSIPCEVPRGVADGMPADCVINTDNLYTIPRAHLRQRIIELSPEQLFQLDSALKYSLDLDW